MRLQAPITSPLADQDAEKVRRHHEEKIVQLQRLPFAAAKVIPNVSLADGVETPIAHGLGRVAQFVSCSVPRGPSTSGRIEEIRSGLNRTEFVVLKASGWGSTITVDVVCL